MEVDRKQRARKAMDEKVNTAQSLRRLMSQIDSDHDGHITWDELTYAHTNSEEFRDLLIALDIEVEDLCEMFSAMDSDGSGTLGHSEFCDFVWKALSADVRLELLSVRVGPLAWLQKHQRQLATRQEEMQRCLGEIRAQLGVEPGDPATPGAGQRAGGGTAARRPEPPGLEWAAADRQAPPEQLRRALAEQLREAQAEQLRELRGVVEGALAESRQRLLEALGRCPAGSAAPGAAGC
ncbi:unnamed protein product, partial [Prorocentrum cordatum]